MSTSGIVIDPEQPPPSYGSHSNNDGLPRYDAVGTSDAPPSYDSLFGEIKQAKVESSGPFDFLKKFITILISTIGCTVCLAITLALPIASIVIGATYRKDEDCPAQPKISTYLIVLGSFGILRNFLGLYNQSKRRFSDNPSDNEEENTKKTACEGLIDCFLIAWFICGNVWIYANYQPNYDNLSAHDYCNKTLYLYAFWLTTSVYILFGLMCCCMCCVVCGAVAADQDN